MGFDLYIMLNLLIDKNTGLPIVYKNFEKEGFDASEYQVPAECRRFVQQSGKWFSNYIYEFEGCSSSAELFLEHYPAWEEAIDGYEDECWTKEDHDEFRNALEWFSKKGNFVVSWSY